MRAYIDTCIISGLVRNQLDDHQREAVLRILQARREGRIQLYTSDVMCQEIERIPREYVPHRTLHQALFFFLDPIPTAPLHVRTPPFDPLSFPFGQKPHRLAVQLATVLRDSQDAAHVYQAARNSITLLVTKDKHSMLDCADRVRQICGVELLSPLDCVKRIDAAAVPNRA